LDKLWISWLKTQQKTFIDMAYSNADQFLKDNKYTIVIVFVIAVGYYIYRQGRKSGSMNFVNLPDGGAGIPSGWSPRPTSVVLTEAMNPSGIGWLMETDGTNEDAIFYSLDGLTRDQRTAVYNDYLVYTQRNLLDDFNSELSGTDLTRALAYFEHVGASNKPARALAN
jgi:hypothetical protein